MKKAAEKDENDNQLRAEYDLCKLKFVGRGIYAERFRKGVTFVLLDKEQIISEPDLNEDDSQ